MDLQLKGKVAIVTGGASGIGAAITEGLAAEGATVVIASRNNRGNKDYADALAAKGNSIHFIEADLVNPGTCEAIIKETVEKFGKIDILVNNAGVNDGASIEGSVEDFRASLDKNIIHVFELVHHALPHLKASKGNILNISSKVADTGQGGTSGYAASKGAMNGLTREWALDLAPHSVRVNTVVPAEVFTPLYDRWLQTLPDGGKEMRAKIEDVIPFERRMTTSEEFGAMCVFVASPLSSHTTGQIIYVDGGYTHLDRKCTLS